MPKTNRLICFSAYKQKILRTLFTYVTASIFIIIGNYNTLFAQNLSKELTQIVEKPRHARIMFYNCENLFDIYDDTLKNDEEFLPDGERHWNNNKYYTKLNNICKVIAAVGGWQPPEFVGLCEIESGKALHDLTKNTPLYLFEYKIIHKESPDRRGIDVALLYNPKSYTPIKNTFITISFPDNPKKYTRDILYSKGVLPKGDTIHLFVNHWPSRWGGQLESEGYRLYVASVLKSHTDSILSVHKNANIVIIGDFNDEPTNKSILQVLKAQTEIGKLVQNKLYNLTYISNYGKSYGTHKFHGNWGILDQIIVSGNLLNRQNGLYTTPESTVIFNAGFLLENDKSYLGSKPYRTFVGFKYNAGYSDHFPVFIDLYREN